MTYTGLGDFVSKAIELTFSLSVEADRTRICPGLACYNVVDVFTSPVFVLAKLLNDYFVAPVYRSEAHDVDIVDSYVSRIMNAYSTGKALPGDRTQNGDSILHASAFLLAVGVTVPCTLSFEL